MKCFYHLDLDGKCAGYLVWHYACLGEEDEKPKYGGGGHKGAAGFASDKYVLGEMSQ